MAAPRPFRFCGGLFNAASAAEWAAGARRLEALGYDTLFTGDHYLPHFLAPVPALLAAGLATTNLRVLCSVFDNDFRHPAALAKEAATLDLLTDGRLEFGIGAGWLKAEYDSVGVPFDAPGVRVERLFEAVRVIKGLWGESPFSYSGQHYTITNIDSRPKPLQQPHPPLFIGGGGKRLLQFAAREADIVGIAPQALRGGGIDRADETEASLARKIDWLREAADDHFEQLELSVLFSTVIVTNDRQSALEQIAAERGLDVEQTIASPFNLVGTEDQIVDRLLELRERHGISYIAVFPRFTQSFASIVARLKSPTPA